MRKVERVGTLEGVEFVLASWDLFREEWSRLWDPWVLQTRGLNSGGGTVRLKARSSE